MKKAKLLSLCLAGAMLFSGCAPKSDAPVDNKSGMTAGTYEATAKGFGGDLKISVTVDADKITAIDVLENSETEAIGGAALPTLVQEVLDSQSIAIDTVSGATVTSNGFIEALKDALTQAGADLDKMSQAVTGNTEKETVELTTDILVIGAGGAGLTASLSALQEGNKVVLLEKMSFAGGASSMAGAGTTATGSKWQIESGYEDSPEMLKADMLANGHNYNDEATLDIFVNTVGAAFDWLVDPEGANVEYDNSEPGRTYSGVGRGAGVVKTLLQRVEDAGGDVYLNTAGTELIIENGKVVGAKAESKDKIYTVNAKAVILATGGFGANDELVPAEYQEFVYAGAAGATGDAIEMTKAVDADLINMEFVNVQPNSIVMPSGLGQYCNPGVGGAYATSGAFLVNENGVRFANEQGKAYDLIQAMKQNKTNYLILDQASFDAFNKGMIGSAIYTEENVKEWLENNGSSNPVMVKGETLEDLAKTLNLPEGSLTAAAEKYNADVAAGTDEFGRKLTVEISNDGPYYAVQMWLRYYATLGGLHINDQMQVLNTNQEAVDGLFAAGEVVGGLEGDIYYGGSLFGWAMTSGRNAGVSASSMIK